MTALEPRESVDGETRLGTLIAGRYRIERVLGEGGMGTVYLAEHTLMQKRVALKVIHPSMSEDAEMRSRFEREAMASSHIDHPNVAAATDFGRTEDGAYFLVLEYIDGANLRDVLQHAPLPVARALNIVRQIALALERAHEAGIVHRDLKPENVMLVRRGKEPDFVKVLDFGMAKILDLDMPAPTSRWAGHTPITRLGTVLGTPEYMAPEQALGEAVTIAIDLYALGIMFFEMLTGLHPFEPPDRNAMLSFHIVAPVPPLADRAPGVDVPKAVEAVVRRLLEKDRTRRFGSARALLEALAEAEAAAGVLAPARGVPRPCESDPPAVTASLAPRWRFASVARVVREQPRARLFWVASALPLGFVVVLAVGLWSLRKPTFHPAAQMLQARHQEPTAQRETVALASARVTDAPPAAPPSEAQNDGQALTKLALEEASRGRPREALETVQRLLDVAPSAANREEILRLVAREAAVEKRGENDERALALLEGAFGEHGVDVLVEFTQNGTAFDVPLSASLRREVRKRAAHSLGKAEVRARASAAAAVFIDLKRASTCAGKRDVLDRAAKVGDFRLLPLLRGLKSARGCGVLGRADCWSCLHHDGVLDETIASIAARSNEREPARTQGEE
jgi:serine/threonine-protein kinase